MKILLLAFPIIQSINQSTYLPTSSPACRRNAALNMEGVWGCQPHVGEEGAEEGAEEGGEEGDEEGDEKGNEEGGE